MKHSWRSISEAQQGMGGGVCVWGGGGGRRSLRSSPRAPSCGRVMFLGLILSESSPRSLLRQVIAEVVEEAHDVVVPLQLIMPGWEVVRGGS